LTWPKTAETVLGRVAHFVAEIIWPDEVVWGKMRSTVVPEIIALPECCI
jgi:hypothetical protein